MDFQLLEKEEFRKFLDQHPLKNFLQTPEIGELRKKAGWTVYYVGVRKNKKILAASMLLCHCRHFGCLEFYAPRGLLVDYEDNEVLSFFVQELKKFIKEKKGYILRIDPYYILRERDINGEIVEGGIDHTQGLENLKKLGFRKSAVNEQISWSFALDLNQDLDMIFKNMRVFTKRCIKKAEKNHVKLRDASYEDISLVKEILDATCSRKHFSNRNLSYFQNLYQLLGERGEVRFVIADVFLKEALNEVEVEIQKEQDIIEKMQKNGSKPEKIALHQQTISQLNGKKQEFEDYILKYGEIASASAGIFITYGDEVLYLFGGNREEFMHLGCPHFMQWEMIRYAKENGFKRYNFYGISGNFNPDDKSYGIYDFKKGFTGYVEELIGEWELPILPVYYSLFQMIRFIRR